MVDNDRMSDVITEWVSNGLKTVLETALNSEDSKVVAFCQREIYPIYTQTVKTNRNLSVPERIFRAFSKDHYFDSSEALVEDSTEYVSMSAVRGW